jgi:alpha-ribazole phosphatase
MTELVIVRHGRTQSNTRSAYCGWTDVELDKEGISQARRAKDKLESMKVDYIFSSPLKRALKTAEIINENFNLPVTCSESLKERNCGVWEDLQYKEICEKFPEQVRMFEKDWMKYCIQNGESALQFYSRVTEFINGLLNKKQGTFLIVTHLGCIRNIVSHLLGMGIEGTWRFRVDNCGITRIQINDEGYAYLTQLNG